MQILVGWEDPTESETIDLCLNVDENSATVTTDPAEFEQAALAGGIDVILMSIDFPSEDGSYSIFEKIRKKHPDTPIIGAWRQGQINQIAKFISSGLHSYFTRDENGEFIFLLTAVIEAAQASVLAKHSQLLAEKLREEVDSVRKLQESVIPQNLPVPDGYAVVARYEPSQIQVVGDRPVVMAGGDYYDIFSLDENTMIIVLGDASGHGVKACMSIMTMHTLISMIRDQKYPNTVEFVNEVNNRLCDNEIVGGDEGGFITLIYCTLDATTHRLQWTSAGHPMPLLQNLETNEVTVLADDDKGGLPLAIQAPWEYELCEATIPPNSRVLLYTDGLDEAFPPSGDKHDQFGLEGIIETLKATKDNTIQEVMERLFEASHEITAGAGRHDDTSIVVLDRK